MLRTLFKNLLLPLSLLSTLYLYNYAIFHGCRFPSPSPLHPAPFRLLALADPQLEGSSNLPPPRQSGPSLSWPLRLLSRQRKRLDIWGNDLYLAHVYGSLRRRLRPSHVTVLGDLLGSQWIDDGEHADRTRRYWDRVFKGARRVPDGVGGGPGEEKKKKKGEVEVEWADTLINVVGNHDVGYAGDMDAAKVARFERGFGRVNWAVTFGMEEGALRSLRGNEVTFHEGARIRLVVLNGLNLDGPAWDKGMERATREFLDAQASSAMGLSGIDAMVLLTHIPLYKREGMCSDGPMMAYWDQERGAGVREQNHLSEEASRKVLDGLFKHENDGVRAGIIVNGHDHEGCDIIHGRHIEKVDFGDQPRSGIADWTTLRYNTTKDMNLNPELVVREVTVRSMMGSYGGHASLISGWFDPGVSRWRFEASSCSLGTQHVWWAVHILDLLTASVGLALIHSAVFGRKPGRDDSIKKDQ